MTEVKRTPGRIVWRELMTNDVDKARGFYGELFGWKYDEMDMGPAHGKYSMAKLDGESFAGMMKISGDMKMPPAWCSYVAVDDPDKVAKEVKARGGQVYFGPEKVKDVGTLGMIADSSGSAVLGIIKSDSPEQPRKERPGVGEFCWETLSTTDMNKAMEFWTHVHVGLKVGKTDMPGMTVLAASDDKNQIDMQMVQGGAPPHFMAFVVVDKLDASRTKAEKMGAKIIVPRIDIPKVGACAIFADPQGAMLGLFESV